MLRERERERERESGFDNRTSFSHARVQASVSYSYKIDGDSYVVQKNSSDSSPGGDLWKLLWEKWMGTVKKLKAIPFFKRLLFLVISICALFVSKIIASMMQLLCLLSIIGLVWSFIN